MRFATISKVNQDSTVNLAFGPEEAAANVATLNGYTPIQYEQVVVAEVDGQPVCLGSVYNVGLDDNEEQS